MNPSKILYVQRTKPCNGKTGTTGPALIYTTTMRAKIQRKKKVQGNLKVHIYAPYTRCMRLLADILYLRVVLPDDWEGLLTWKCPHLLDKKNANKHRSPEESSPRY